MASANFQKENFYRLIGKVVVEFNDLETLMVYKILGLLNITSSREAPGVIAHLSFADKSLVMRTLILKMLGEKAGQKFKTLYTKLKEVGEKRNDLLHSSWFLGFLDSNDEGEILRLNLKDDFRKAHITGAQQIAHALEDFVVNQGALKKFLKEVKDLRKELYSFFEEFRVRRI